MSLATIPGCADPNVAPVRHGRLRSLWANLAQRRGLRELTLIAVIYSLYDGSRFIVEGRQSTALAHAMRVLHVETLLNMDWEQSINRVVSSHEILAITADYMYATMHYLVTPLVLIWMWRKHRDAYPRARTTLAVATVLGLVGFTLLPVAPPRMLPGFVDTMAQYSGFGWWGVDASAPRGVGSFTNEFAAMPSLHVGWALWCGWQLIRHGKHRITQIAGVAYPALITMVVVATGNHYLLDAIAGIAVVMFAGAAVGLTIRLLPKPKRGLVIERTSIERNSIERVAAAPRIPSQCDARGDA